MSTLPTLPANSGSTQHAPAISSTTAPNSPSNSGPRITLTAPTLAGARERHVLIAGPDKRAALDRALEATDTAEAPIRVVLDGATVHYAD